MAEAKKPFSEQVAENLIEQLKAGTAPWQRPWEAGDGASMFPMNPTTGKRYRGINAIHLMAQGRTDQRWMTFKQAQAVDAQVRKGERGTPIQYWKFTDEQTKLDDQGRPVLDAKGEPVKQVVKLERPRVFMATVFNAEQIDGLPVLERKPQTWDANERAEAILKASGADIRHGGDRAFYRPSSDFIQMPDRGQFPDASKYYATAIHELGHWTGHETRLDRDLANPFGSEAYAKEELRAEIASMILGAEIGLGHDPGQHVAYVASWIKALKEDPMEIFRAAADAEKIQDFVLALEQKQEQELAQGQQPADVVALAVDVPELPELDQAVAIALRRVRDPLDDNRADAVAALRKASVAAFGFALSENWTGRVDIIGASPGGQRVDLVGLHEGDPVKSIAIHAQTTQRFENLTTVEVGDGLARDKAVQQVFALQDRLLVVHAHAIENKLWQQEAFADIAVKRNSGPNADFAKLAAAQSVRREAELRALAHDQQPQLAAPAYIDKIGVLRDSETEDQMPTDWIGVARSNTSGFFYVGQEDGKRTITVLDVKTYQEAEQQAVYVKALMVDTSVVLDSPDNTFTHFDANQGNETGLADALRANDLTTVHSVTGHDPARFMEVALTRLSPVFGLKPEDDTSTNAYFERKGLAQAFALQAEQIYEKLTKEREAVQVPPTPAQDRQAEIQAELAALGYRMEPSLDALAGDEGHALIDLSTGEVIDPPNDAVLSLASEWSRLEGVTDDQETGIAIDAEKRKARFTELTEREAAVAEAFKQLRELPGNHPERQAKAQAFTSAAKEMLNVPLPSDWSGNVQIIGVAERDGRKIDAANVGVDPEEFHLYARRENVEFGSDAYALVAVHQTEDQAMQAAESLALIEAHAHSNPLEQAARLAYVNEQRVRNDPTSTDEAISAAKEARKNAEFLATTNDADLQKRISEEERLLAQRANDQAAPAQARQPDQAKTFINVPFKEKNEAKALGAKWDREAQSWYIPPGIDADPFAKWQPNGQNQAQEPAKAVRQGPGEGESSQALKTPESSRQYLAVPYGERNAAKAAGAKWDATAKSWYAPADVDPAPLQRWLPQNVQAEQAPAQSPTDEFAEAMQSVGLTVPAGHPIMDGKRHRVPVVDDKKGEKTGFYIGHLDGHPAGYIKNNRSGVDMKWKSKGYTLDPEQKAVLQAEAAQKLQERAAELAATQQQVAQRVVSQMRYLEPIMEPTPYLQAKGIAVHPGAFTDREGQKTYIPVYDKEGTQWSMQYIQEDGTKRFPKDSRKEGCFHIVGGWKAIDDEGAAPAIVIAEGYATAATLAEALGHGTVAAFDSGNLKAVAQTFRELYPDKAIVICGDDDLAVQEKYGRNPGKAAAIEAAEAVGGKYIVPIFAPGEQASNPKGFTDFNDLATKSSLGAERVRGQVLPMVELAVQQANERKLTQAQQQGINQGEKPAQEQQRARRAMSH